LAIDIRRTLHKIAKGERGLWQRRYWEHANRDGADLERHIALRRPRGHARAKSARFATLRLL
jgi:putative transposase